MDYRCRLGLLDNSSTASESNDPQVVCRLELYAVRPSGLIFFRASFTLIHSHTFLLASVSLSYFNLADPIVSFFLMVFPVPFLPTSPFFLFHLILDVPNTQVLGAKSLLRPKLCLSKMILF